MKKIVYLAIAAMTLFAAINASAQNKEEKKETENKNEKKVEKEVNVTANKNNNSMKVITIVNGDTTTREFSFTDINDRMNEMNMELTEMADDIEKEFSYMFKSDDENEVIVSSGGKITKIIIETDEDDNKGAKKKSRNSKKVVVQTNEEEQPAPGASTVVVTAPAPPSEPKAPKSINKTMRKEIHTNANETGGRNDVRFDEKEKTLVMDFWLPSEGETAVKVEDASGKVLYDRKFDGKKAQYNREIQLSEKPSGPLKLTVKQKNFELEKVK